jgi:DMSO/TMAO reductase YedYZ molybdopterin-dependent catalytic subunit
MPFLFLQIIRTLGAVPGVFRSSFNRGRTVVHAIQLSRRTSTTASGLPFWRCALALFLLFFSLAPSPARAQDSRAILKISGDVTTPLTLTIDDLKKLPRKTLSVVNPHEKRTEVYEGVLLMDLLQKAGVPRGEALRGPAMATYLLFQAEDGYRALFSLPELDPAFLDSDVLIADTLDGNPLPAKVGPFRLVAPHDKRPARWIRMLNSITVTRVPAT